MDVETERLKLTLDAEFRRWVIGSVVLILLVGVTLVWRGVQKGDLDKKHEVLLQAEQEKTKLLSDALQKAVPHELERLQKQIDAQQSAIDALKTRLDSTTAGKP